MPVSFEALRLSKHIMHPDPLSGNLFVPINRRATQVRAVISAAMTCVMGQASKARSSGQQLDRRYMLRNGPDKMGLLLEGIEPRCKCASATKSLLLASKIRLLPVQTFIILACVLVDAFAFRIMESR